MQVIAAREAGFSRVADDGSAGDLLSFFYGNGRKMPVNGLQSIAVVNHHGIPVNAEKPSTDDSPAVGRGDGSVLGHRKVESEMVLAVNLPALVDLGPSIGESGHDFSVPHHDKRTVPQKRRFRFLSQFPDRLAVF